MEDVPFHMGISLIVIFFEKSYFHRLGCRLMKTFRAMDLVVVS